jgi:hypothetical protein
VDVREARGILLAAIGGMAWEATRGHPDEVRIDTQNRALLLGDEAIDVLVRAGHAAGRDEAFEEVGGQLRL